MYMSSDMSSDLLYPTDHRERGDPWTGIFWSDKILWLEESDYSPIGH